jgi:cytochrome c-type biogenesis protein
VIAQAVRRLPARLASSSVWRRPLAFSLALVALFVTWAGIAVVYSHAAPMVAAPSTRDVVTAATSTIAHSGAVDASAVFVTNDYFRAFRLAPDSLGSDPARGQLVIVNVDTHEVNLPEPATWVNQATLQLPGQDAQASAWARVLLRSEHHQSVAIQFPVRSSSAGTALLRLPAMEDGAEALQVLWSLPLQFPTTSRSRPLGDPGASLGALLAVMAGLLVVFSPCAFHMTGVFVPTVTGLGIRNAIDRRTDRAFRRHVARLGLAFVSGFVLLYTAIGAIAGLAGHLISDTTRLAPWMVPMRVAAGTLIVILALQALGLFRLPFVVRLGLPGNPQRYVAEHGYLAAALAGINVSAGCMTCVGGTLLASLLVYAGASGSAVSGGLTLFLFAMGVSVPFLLIALAFDRVLPALRKHWRLLQYSSPVAAAVMLVVGLLVITGHDSLIEQLVLRPPAV